jgi:hypothetical protein
MLRGRFGTASGRPYLEGRLIIPRLNLRANLTFLVDTGADCTTLMPSDALRMGIDYAALSGTDLTVGVGGTSLSFLEDAYVAFPEPKRALHVYHIDLRITPDAPELMDIPSLLGRDVLNHWRMSYNPTKDRLTFTVVSADLTVPL